MASVAIRNVLCFHACNYCRVSSVRICRFEMYRRQCTVGELRRDDKDEGGRGGRRGGSTDKTSSSARHMNLDAGCWFVVVPNVEWWVRRQMYGAAVWFWPCSDEHASTPVPWAHTCRPHDLHTITRSWKCIACHFGQGFVSLTSTWGLMHSTTHDRSILAFKSFTISQ